MKGVSAFPDEKCTVVSGILARRACRVELHAADSTQVVLGHVPAPGRNGVPLLDGDFHVFV